MALFSRPTPHKLTISLIATSAVGLGLVMPPAALADTPIEYVERAGDLTGPITETLKTINNYQVVSEDDITWGTADTDTFVVVNKDVTLTNRPEVKGNVHLILVNGKTLTAPKGITVVSPNSLAIHGQNMNTNDDGKLVAKNTYIPNYNAVIGSTTGSDAKAGAITIHGGQINVATVSAGAGIGGAGTPQQTTQDGTVVTPHNEYSQSEPVTIFDGRILAESDGEGAAIGGGQCGAGDVNIFGGLVGGIAYSSIASKTVVQGGGNNYTFVAGRVTGCAPDHTYRGKLNISETSQVFSRYLGQNNLNLQHHNVKLTEDLVVPEFFGDIALDGLKLTVPEGTSLTTPKKLVVGSYRATLDVDGGTVNANTLVLPQASNGRINTLINNGTINVAEAFKAPDEGAAGISFQPNSGVSFTVTKEGNDSVKVSSDYKLQYKIDGDDWRDNTSFTDLTAGKHTISARLADENSRAFYADPAPQTVEIAPAAPAVKADYINDAVGITSNDEKVTKYQICADSNCSNPGDITVSEGKVNITDLAKAAGVDLDERQTLYVRALTEDGVASTTVPVVVGAAPKPEVSGQNDGKVSGLQEGETYQVRPQGSTNEADWKPLTKDTILEPGTYQVRQPATKDRPASLETTITIPRPAPNLTGQNDGKVAGLKDGETYEYRPQSSTNEADWKPLTKDTILEPGTYHVRQPKTGDKPASLEGTITIPRPAPNLTGQNDGKVAGLKDGETYQVRPQGSTNETDWQTLTKDTILEPGTYQVRQPATKDKPASLEATITIPRPAPNLTGQNDGKVTGLKDGETYQVRPQGSTNEADWKTLTKDTVLEPGTYQVRQLANGDKPASLEGTITIPAPEVKLQLDLQADGKSVKVTQENVPAGAKLVRCLDAECAQHEPLTLAEDGLLAATDFGAQEGEEVTGYVALVDAADNLVSKVATVTFPAQSSEDKEGQDNDSCTGGSSCGSSASPLWLLAIPAVLVVLGLGSYIQYQTLVDGGDRQPLQRGQANIADWIRWLQKLPVAA